MALPRPRLEAPHEDRPVADVADPAGVVEVADLEARAGRGVERSASRRVAGGAGSSHDVYGQSTSVRLGWTWWPGVAAGCGRSDGPTERQLGDRPRGQLDRRSPRRCAARGGPRATARPGNRRSVIERTSPVGCSGRAGQPDAVRLEVEHEARAVRHGHAVGVLGREPQPVTAEQLVAAVRRLPAERPASRRAGSGSIRPGPAGRSAGRPSRARRPTGARCRAAGSRGRGSRRRSSRPPRRSGSAAVTAAPRPARR